VPSLVLHYSFPVPSYHQSLTSAIHSKEKSSGDENVILAKISDEVGYGVFAGKDFQQGNTYLTARGARICKYIYLFPSSITIGDYIIRYGGMIVGEEEITDWSYAMSTGVEGVVLDAKKYRNLAGMLNHSGTYYPFLREYG